MDSNDWQSHVNAFEASGHSARAYCTEHDLVYHRFKYWQRKFRGEARSAGGFASVSIPRDFSTGQPLAVAEFPSGIRLVIYDASVLTYIAGGLGR